MGILNTIITTALCITMTIGTFPLARQSESPLTGTPQTQQTNNTPDTLDMATRRGSAPHTMPASDTSGTPSTADTPDTGTDTGRSAPATHGTPAAPLASEAPLAQSAPLSGDGTDQPSSARLGGTAGTQSGTCTPVAGTWGQPANDAVVNNVSNRDPSAVQWDIDAQCTLTVHHGTSPDYHGATGTLPWSTYHTTITKVRIDGNLTLHSTSNGNDNPGVFHDLLYVSEIQIDGTLHISGTAGYNAFPSFLTAFTGNGTAAIETSQATSMYGMFYNCRELTSLDVTHFDTSNVTNMRQMFSNCEKLTSLDVTHFDTSNVTNMRQMFFHCEKLTSLDLTHFDTSNVTNMRQMFGNCEKLTSLDLTHFDTSNVTDMNSMFMSCSTLTLLDLTHFDTSNVTDMRCMFFECKKLTSLDLTHFDTSNVTNISSMFTLAEKLTSLDLTHFDTSNVTDMSWMFYGCDTLTTLDLSNFNTTSLDGSTNGGVAGMFSNCKSLESLNLSGFDTSKADHNAMFKKSPRLRELWLGRNTYLAMYHSDTSANLDPKNWVELTAPGGPTPVPDMYDRTEHGSGRNPRGHYVHALLVVSVDYNNGQDDHSQNLSLDPSIPGSKKITWTDLQGTLRPAPAGKVFGGWDFTTSDPAHVSLTDSTLAWTEGVTAYGITTAKLTARWRTVGQPALSINVHADGTPNPDGGTDPWAEVTATMPAPASTGDTVRIESLNGTGRTADCTPATGSATCTMRATITQLRDAADYDAAYHVRAAITATDRRSISDTANTNTYVTGPSADKEGILPYTTINYLTGTGTGTPPATAKALTDTHSRTARITVSGPSPITRPEHSLFTDWQANHGTAAPGTSPVPASLGDTDPQGRTTIDLTAQWTLLDAPANITATRNPADNSVTISGTAKPRNNTDTIHICHPAPNAGTQCHDTTTDTTDQHGNRLPYDGATEHPWHTTLPATTPDGDWTIDTTLTTNDPAYPTGNQQVDSPTAHANIHIPSPTTHTSAHMPSPAMSTLALTGGNNRPVLLALAVTLAAAMLLLAAANTLRNRRSRRARHKTCRTQDK